MRTVSVIGIGAGDPRQITVQAIDALNTVDVVFMMDKGAQKQELSRLRREICERYITGRSYRIVVVADPDLAERIAFIQNAPGGVPGPFDAWLTLRGIKTLAARMDRHCRNAMRVAQMLAEHPAVAQVFYPGLPTHPGHKTAQEQMRAFGGMVSFRLLAGEEAAVQACARTRLFTLGESLGGVESLIEHPARMTHASVTGSELEVPGDLIRLSVGIEDCDDLLDDLREALQPD